MKRKTAILLTTTAGLSICSGAAQATDSLRRYCPQGHPVSSPFAVAEIQLPTILPDRCRALAYVPAIVYRCDPHGAIDPLGATIVWREVTVYFEYPEEHCHQGKKIIGKYTANDGVGHGIWELIGTVDSQ